MSARLGKIIYWAFCIFAVLWLAVGLRSDGRNISEWDMPIFMLILGGAVILWAIGFAIRYILLAE